MFSVKNTKTDVIDVIVWISVERFSHLVRYYFLSTNVLNINEFALMISIQFEQY